MNPFKFSIQRFQCVDISVEYFNGMEWNCFEYTSTTTIANLPYESQVYCVFITKKRCRNKVLCYIGVTSDLTARFASHDKIHLLLANKKDYRIYIMYRTFGDFNTNRESERMLIRQFCPPFNGHYKSMKKFTQMEFWLFLGVKKIKTLLGIKRENYSKFYNKFNDS